MATAESDNIMSRFLNRKYETLEPYTPGEQPKVLDLIKLNTNENPYGPSPEVLKVINEEEVGRLQLYSDPEAAELVEAIAENFGVSREQVAVGNGSDEILAFCFMAFQPENGKVYFPDPSYGFYKVYGDVFKADRHPVPLNGNLEIVPEDYKNLDGTIIIANPNAPTGIALETGVIEEIIKSNPDNLVIIDEAYVDFGAKSCVPFIDKYDNILVIQTFSKSRSLAGSRVGFALGNKELIADINRIKFSFNPYNLDRLAIRAAAAAMRDDSYFQMTRRQIMETREYTVREMEALGFEVLPSKANFIFARNSRIAGKEYFEGLREKNILVRYFGKKPIEDYVRITIGKREDMEALLSATKELLERQ